MQVELSQKIAVTM